MDTEAGTVGSEKASGQATSANANGQALAATGMAQERLRLGDPPSHRSSQVPTVVIAALLSLHALYVARAAFFPLVTALLIALPLRPLVRLLRTRLRIPSFFGALICVVSLVGIGSASTFWLMGPAKEWIREAPATFKQVETKLAGVFESVEQIEEASDELGKIASGGGDEDSEIQGTESKPMQVEIKPRSFVSTLLNTTSNFIAGVSICIGMVFILLAFGDNFQRAAVRLLPDRPGRRNALEMMEEIENVVSNYLLTYTCINIGLGIVLGSVMWLLGLPNPILWGVMACVLNFVPFVGLILGTGVVGVVALVTFDSVAYAMLAPLLYLAINGLEANCVTPGILGRRMQLNVIPIFISIVLIGWMWGIGGAIVAVPLLALGKIFCDHYAPLHRIGELLGTAD